MTLRLASGTGCDWRLTPLVRGPLRTAPYAIVSWMQGRGNTVGHAARSNRLCLGCVTLGRTCRHAEMLISPGDQKLERLPCGSAPKDAGAHS